MDTTVNFQFDHPNKTITSYNQDKRKLLELVTLFYHFSLGQEGG